jgi:hypothetical protein
MDTKDISNLRTRYELKNRNGVDTSEEFFGIIEEYIKDNPHMTDSELWQFVLYEYRKLCIGFPDMDAAINLKHMIKYLKEIIKVFENTLYLKCSEEWRKETLSKLEGMLNILLESISDVIHEYVGDYYVSQNEEDEILSRKAESYTKTLYKMDLVNINITDYYCNHMIPFYKFLYKKIHDALNGPNKDILRQVANLITNELLGLT